MPEISRFLGIVIYMYFNDHNPPHFHAVYNDYKASISIKSLGLMEGKLPSRVMSLVIERAEYLFYLAFRDDPDLQEQFRAWGYIA